ncbi:MAG TPA: 2-hydroxyacid dehydrogenase [Xanthobacteraceae bacterium]|nr:2-hydroxyacid dehydrogenase [Xanthobacteraceae bacterium]
MADDKPAALFIGPPKKDIQAGLAAEFTVHSVETPDRLDDATLARLAPHLRFVAVGGHPGRADSALMQRLGKLEIVANFGVGYDNVDAKWAAANGIIVTNTPDVLNEEVADTALGLLLCTVRELPRAERYLRSGEWARKGDYRLTASLRDRTVGLVGLGRIGRVIADRLAAMKVPVVYHSRRPKPDAPYRYYASLLEMARAVDVLLTIVPGGAETRHMINTEVLEALGPNGIFINMARGSVVDEQALVEALKTGKILSAGLDVFANEPHVPQELVEMDHVVLTPHVGSASEATRRAMEQLVVDNLVNWKYGRPPLTPVPETPWPRRGG